MKQSTCHQCNFWFTIFLSAFLTYSKADPCENNSPLPFPYDRYVTNNISGSEVSVLHDRHLERAWYRVGHALDMATTAPSLLQCGTTFPVWMNGNYSSVNVLTSTCYPVLVHRTVRIISSSINYSYLWNNGFLLLQTMCMVVI